MTAEKKLLTSIEPLCHWYEKNHRSLPWREEPTPYHVWISEIMLQQTRVEAVKSYYHRFLNYLPKIEDLANIEEEELLKLWEGLGYYSRAKNLKKAAIVCMEQYKGMLPNSYEALLKLPGIGSYTAGAIASIAYDIVVPAVDGNVLRVVSRILASKEDIANPKVKKNIEQLLQKVMDQKEKLDAGTFNQAMMELGATVCIPNGTPLCDKCPLNMLCEAHQHKQTEVIPVKAPKKPRRIEEKTVFLVHAGEQILLHKRANKGLLADMYELPNVEGSLSLEEGKNHWKSPKKIEERGNGKHIFTHVQWNLVGYEVWLSEQVDFGEDWVWVTLEQVKNQYAVPSAFSFLTKILKDL